MEHSELERLAVECGAAKAAVIPQEAFVFSPEFREACRRNACGVYGKCWVCPPDLGEIDDLIREARSYPWGLLYQTIAELEDSYDFEGMAEASKVHAQVSQKLRAKLAPLLPGRQLHLSCGGCHLCETCAKIDGIPCRHPDDALASLEGYGVDVYNTCRKTELRYINGKDTVTYFGAVFFEEKP